MVTIRPIRRALVPVDSDAARRVSALNYDEFQGDLEIWEAIRAAPESVLSVTMAHCAVATPDRIAEGDSEASLRRARGNFDRLRASPLTRERRRILYIYEIVDPGRPGVRQIGLGGLARTAEIRTEATPGGPIIRNEGVRPPKARGRARLIEATRAIIGTVNNAVPDESGGFARTLERRADEATPDFEVEGAGGTTHRIWLIREPGAVARLQRLLADEPEAYVADGNHRSAAAAMLGHESFLAVFFPADRMGIAPYNRLVRLPGHDPDAVEGAVEAALRRSFDVAPAGGDPIQPRRVHEIGIYTAEGGWRRATPRGAVLREEDASASIDHDIVQRTLFADLGIPDAGDERLTFVGANRDAAWLAAEVDGGRARFAVTLPAVTMSQFVAVCRQRRMMPPKSTWFEPKIRSGLVMALLQDD
ncbi:DUF1015 family protein [Candidatus Palauibacter sp.]|uniref:DUF1015 family protein n=1 Tax=Candidatus Palauibacter sp. TaxID=3101350 RepID=UPI003B02E440